MPKRILNLHGKEKQTLYIIGNGFDLYHGAKTKYRHFCSWLNLNDHEDFVDTMEWFFTGLNYRQCNLWSNFENVLRNYDSQELYQQLRHKTDDVWDDNALDKTVKEFRDLVKVLGHSMSIIDREYFHAVRERVHHDTHWYFSTQNLLSDAESNIYKCK